MARRTARRSSSEPAKNSAVPSGPTCRRRLRRDRSFARALGSRLAPSHPLEGEAAFELGDHFDKGRRALTERVRKGGAFVHDLLGGASPVTSVQRGETSMTLNDGVEVRGLHLEMVVVAGNCTSRVSCRYVETSNSRPSLMRSFALDVLNPLVRGTTWNEKRLDSH